MMIVFPLALAAICLYKIKFSSFHSDYMSIPVTSSVKGAFAVMILFSHLRNYIVLSDGLGDRLFAFFLNLFGQLMVTMFFFYSGFGIMESFQKKENYHRGFLKKRALKILVHFDIAVLLFAAVGLLVGKIYPWQNYAFSLIGWESIGNSNWFIFVILALYLITFPSMLLAKRSGRQNGKVLLLWVTLFCVALWVPLFLLKGDVWCNTLLCYPTGMLFSLIKPWFDGVIQRSKLSYCGITGFLAVAFLGLYLLKRSVVVYSVVACLFVLLFTALTAKVKIDNGILRWLGKHAFSIYILQRLPMILLRHWGLSGNILLFSALSLVATLLLAAGFQKLTDFVDKKCFC